MKNLPKRTCVGCKEVKDKKELIRIVKDKEGHISVDRTGRANGRGAYICDNIQCLESAIKSRKLEKSFEIKINPEIYDELRKTIK